MRDREVWEEITWGGLHQGRTAQVGPAYAGGGSDNRCADPEGCPGSYQRYEKSDGWCV